MSIAALPQLPQLTFQIVKNGDFRDALQFVQDATANPAAPIDLTGIAFACTLRDGAGEPAIAMTSADLLVVDGPNGVLAFAVPLARLKDIPAGSLSGDIVATANGMTINLCKDNGPLTFIVRDGLT
ncbi:MAG: hypothetical protein KGL46_04100 [Hyphomicrobiales bacterium]|nr:hypothetical protein [Hyphomicrobiales bacterium]